ncbi:MAG TPA: glycosyltransferase family 4 protein [Magnetospirillum sp.]|nr:glycosyltransferase family 4 protein [Magnetospirillum sp.]
MHVALFAEVDPNLAEGPATWLASVAEVLAGQGHRVTVLLRARRTRPEVLAPLDTIDAVELIDPFALGWTSESERRQLSVGKAAEFLERLDADRRFDTVIVRGSMAARAAAGRRKLRGRLAFYLTDFPQDEHQLGWWARWRLRRTILGGSLLLVQTPEIGAYLTRVLALPPRLPLHALPPMVTDAAFALGRAGAPKPGEPLRLVYAGKFAPAWNTLEMTALPAAMARRGVAAELHVAGDKFLDRPDPTFPQRMRDALARPGVIWHGGMARIEVLRLTANAHVGLSWRAPELDASLELSTKLLEYGALGLPVVCNPTAMHRRLLGDDYPGFAAGEDDVAEALARLANPEIWQAAAAASARLAERHCGSSVGASLSAALQGVFG